VCAIWHQVGDQAGVRDQSSSRHRYCKQAYQAEFLTLAGVLTHSLGDMCWRDYNPTIVGDRFANPQVSLMVCVRCTLQSGGNTGGVWSVLAFNRLLIEY